MLEIQSKRVSKASTWRAIIAQRQNSGMTIAAFCKAHGLKEYTFQYWQKKFSLGLSSAPKSGGGFVALANHSDRLSQKARIILPNGVQVDLGGGLDSLAVQQFLQNLCGVTGARS